MPRSTVRAALRFLHASKLAQPVQELPRPEILSVPWSHNIVMTRKIKDPAIRLWYAAKTLEIS